MARCQPDPTRRPLITAKSGVIAAQTSKGAASVTTSMSRTTSSSSTVSRIHMSWTGSPGASSPRQSFLKP